MFKGVLKIIDEGISKRASARRKISRVYREKMTIFLPHAALLLSLIYSEISRDFFSLKYV